MLVERLSKPLTWGKVRLGSLGNTFAERVARSLLVVTVALGLWLRTRGYLFSTISLWLDEAAWVRFLFEQPPVKHLFRPIGFMGLSNVLASILGASERVLRFMPWTAGIATMLMAPFIGRRLFRSEAARLLFVAIIAFDPSAIDLAKEFKPYSISIALHAGILCLALRYSETRCTRDLWYLLALILPAALFAQDSVFAFPGAFLLVGIDALRGHRQKQLITAAAAAAVTALLLGACYYFMWRHIPQSDDNDWGRKYNIFYLEEAKGAAPAAPQQTKTDWVAERYTELAKTPGERRIIWTSRSLRERALSELSSAYGIVWAGLNFVGIALIAARKQWREGLLLVLPLVTMALFNVLGFWPFGPFRANAFVIVYTAGIASVVFDRSAQRTRLADALPASALVFLPLFAFERGWHRQKEMPGVTAPSAFAEIPKELISLQGADFSGPKEKLVADNWSCDPWRYYVKYNPYVKKTMGAELSRRFGLLCRKEVSAIFRTVRAQTRRGRRAWIVASNQNTITDLERDWPPDLEKTQLVHIEGSTHLLVEVSPTPPKHEAVPPPPPPEDKAAESDEMGGVDGKSVPR